jgi:diguanylate cyclase (GGDEF)-like protein
MKKHLRLEAALGLLVISTLLAISLQDAILEKKLIINNQNGYGVRLYDDSESGGNSLIDLEDPQNLKWSCQLRGQYIYPFCGFEVIFDPARIKGLDLRNFTKIRLNLSYSGPGQTVRVFLRNYDPAYSTPKIEKSTKYNQIEFSIDWLNSATEFSLKDFFVADWWLLENNIPPQLSHPQFDNIVILDIQTGSGKSLGKHSFQLHQVELTGQRLSTADWYLSIIISWLMVIVSFLIYRVTSLKDQVIFQRKRESALIEVNSLLDARSKILELKTKTDFLTGAFNRRAIEEAIRAGLNDWRNHQKPLSLIMIDIDYFKKINDTYGHDVGDKVLASLAIAVQQKIRTQDLFARWGGEEFVLLCSDTDTLNAHILAEKLRYIIANLSFSEGFQITASFGVTTLKAQASLDDLFKAADTALYQAKNTGRNRVVVNA